MKNNYSPLMSAKASRISGGGNSQCSTSRSIGAQRFTLRSIGAQYFTRFLGSSCRVWKYVACMLLAFFIGVGNVWAVDPQDTYYSFPAAKSGGSTISADSGEDNVITLQSSCTVTSVSSGSFAGTSYSYGLKIDNNSSTKGCSFTINASKENPAHVFILGYASGKIAKLRYNTSDVATAYLYAAAGKPGIVELVTTESGAHTLYADGAIYCYKIIVLYEKNTNIAKTVASGSAITIGTTIDGSTNELLFFKPMETAISDNGYNFDGTSAGYRKSIVFTAHINGLLTVKGINTTTNNRQINLYAPTDNTTNGEALATVPNFKKADGEKILSYGSISKGTTYAIDGGSGIRITYISLAPTYTVTYNLDGGLYDGSATAPTQTAVVSGAKINMPTLTPTKEGYTFLGWTCNVSSVDYAEEAEYTMTAANTTFTAHWAAASALYDITISTMENGDVTASPASQIENGTVTLTVTPDEGYKLNALSVTGDDSGNDIEVTNNQFEMPEEDVTVNATFRALYTYEISYAKGSAEGVTGSKAAESKTEDEDFTLPDIVFEREGYVQSGWATSDGGSKAYELGGSYTTNAAQAFYPVWTELKNVIYHANGGEGKMSQTQGIGETKLSDNTYTKSGYVFAGWATSQSNADAGTIAYADGANVTLSDEDIALYAVWYTPLYSFAPTLTEGSLSANDVVETSTGGSMTFTPFDDDTDATLKYTSSGLEFGKNSNSAATVTTTNAITEGSLIIAKIHIRDKKTRGLKLCTGSSTTDLTEGAWSWVLTDADDTPTPETKVCTYTVNSTSALKNATSFRLVRNNTAYLQYLYVAKFLAPLSAITGLAEDGTKTTATSLTFTWDEVSNASSYDVYLYEDEDCETLVGSKANVTTNSKEFTGLTPNTDYYCKVQAIGDGVSYTDGPLSDYLNGKTKEAPKYDVTYVSAKGVAPAEAEQVYSVVLPQISPVTGFVHTGWTANQTVVVDEETVTAETTIVIGKTAVLSANTTFTAVWSTAYTLTLDPKGGTTEDAEGWSYDNVNDLYSKVVAKGADVDLPTFSKASRAFKTWRKAGPADVESPVTVTGDLTLTAVWNATVEQVIYSWEGAEGGATEFGGTAVGSAEKMINQESGDYYCLKVDGKADWSTTNISITLSGSEKVKTGDKIKFTAFYNKGKDGEAQSANSSLKMYTATTSGTKIFDMGDSELLPNIYGGGNDPAYYTKTVPAGIDVSTVYMTRSQAGSTAWITKLQIVREVVTEEGNLLTVTLNYNDGGATENGSIAVLSGQKVAQPADPTWAHHRFNGWKLNSSAYDFSSDVTENITLVADWTQLYTITYAKGDEGATGDAPVQEDKAQGETFTVAANTFTAQEGKEFSKWNDGSADYKAGDTYTVGTDNVVLTAQWIIIPDRYTVIYMDGENELGREEVEVGSKPAGIAEPKKALFAFASWQESGSDIALDANSWTSRAKNAEVTLTVRWETGYATTIDYEGFIDVNGTGGNWQAELLNHCYAISGTEGVTLDAPGGKPADKGLKIKKDGTTVTFNAAAGKLVTLKVGVLSGAKFSEDNGSNYTTLTGASDSYSASKFTYYYHAEAKTYKFATTTDSYNILKKVSITAPYVVTFSAEYGTTPAAQTFYGTGLTLPTEIAGTEKWFGGWYTDEARTEEVTLTGGKFIPTGDCTLYAKQLDKSDDATLSDLKVDGATVNGFAANTYIYKIEVPYGTDVDALPKITEAMPTDANATYRLSPAAGPEWNDTYQCYLQQVIVTPEDEVTEHIKYYHVRITIADKEGVAMIAINVPAGNGNAQTIPEANISGYIGGTATQKIQSGKKLGSEGHYIGFTLANGETLKTGDILRLNVSDINGATAVTLFEDASSNHPVKAIPWTYKPGVNNIKLPEEVDGLNTLYIYRNDGSCNPTLTEVSIIRPMNPVITEFELGGAVGEVDEPNKRIIVSLPKNTTLDEDGTPTTTIYSNTAEVSVGKTIVTNGGAWQYGDNTYRVTDKDGDYTDYTIRIYQQTRENLTAGKMSSSCYNRAVSMYRGVTFYELAGGLDGNIASDGSTGGAPTMLLFMEVERLEAGKPYLYVPTEDGQPMEVAFTGDAAGSEVDYRGFHGSFAGIPAAPDNILVNKYIVYNNTIQKCGQNCYIGANRAYFDIDEVPCYSTKEACYEAAEAEARTAGRIVKRLRRIALSNQETNTATALDAISEDGGVVVREGCYDVLGRKIEAPAQTGFYIVNGQKIIVR